VVGDAFVSRHGLERCAWQGNGDLHLRALGQFGGGKLDAVAGQDSGPEGELRWHGSSPPERSPVTENAGQHLARTLPTGPCRGRKTYPADRATQSVSIPCAISSSDSCPTWPCRWRRFMSSWDSLL